MHPISHHQENGITIFDYNKDEYAEFIKQGEETGDVGMTIKSRDGDKLSVYEGFGTYEHPCKSLLTVTVMHLPLMNDGPPPTEDEICNPKPANIFENGKWIMLDLSDT